MAYDGYGNIVTIGGDSPLSGKRVCIIGDSNMQYSGSNIKSYLEETYGCIVTVLAQAGVTWEYGGTVENISEITNNCGIGRVNQLISQTGDSGIITNYDYIVFMLGTNYNTVGSLTDSATTYGTVCGAVRYCCEKMQYYARAIKWGIVIPFRWSDGYSTSNTYEMPTVLADIAEIARRFSVPTLNLWNYGRVIPDSMMPNMGSAYYLQDEKHLGGNGTDRFKQRLGKWLAYEL